MDREFLEHYNRELKVLGEQAQEFAAEYPGIAERLGGLVGARADPTAAGLLEGAAFLAARVQLKLKHEFSEFTSNLLDQIVPHYLAPTPSALLAQVVPPYGDPALRDGRRIARGSYLDAVYVEREHRIACRYQTAADITLWPFEVTAADYLNSGTALQALGLPVGPDVVAGLRVQLSVRSARQREDEASEAQSWLQPEGWLSASRASTLTVHLLGSMADAVMIYEQIFGNAASIFFRYLDAAGTPVIVPAPPDTVRPVGFGDDEALLPNDRRIFRGYDLLRDYFLFPRKFLGFELCGLARILPKLEARSVDLIFACRRRSPRLQVAVSPELFALYAAPAVNLFEKTTDRVPMRTTQHEFHVVPDRSRPTDFEVHRILDVHGHAPGRPDKVTLQPLYSAPKIKAGKTQLHYTVRRIPRMRSAAERRRGGGADYLGTETFLSVSLPDAGDEAVMRELSVRALCSNRHLAEHMPVGESGADFTFLDDTSLAIRCIDGPTRPRDSIVGEARRAGEGNPVRPLNWRLVNLLAVNQLGLVERGAGKDAAALRETLTLFADPSDSASESQIRGLRSLDSRPVVRRIRQRHGVGVARGIEITLSVDEKAFEGSGAFLLGALLDRFFAEYAAVNHFTQTVLRSTERGEIMRWPPRAGLRNAL